MTSLLEEALREVGYCEDPPSGDVSPASSALDVVDAATADSIAGRKHRSWSHAALGPDLANVVVREDRVMPSLAALHAPSRDSVLHVLPARAEGEVIEVRASAPVTGMAKVKTFGLRAVHVLPHDHVYPCRPNPSALLHDAVAVGGSTLPDVAASCLVHDQATLDPLDQWGRRNGHALTVRPRCDT